MGDGSIWCASRDRPRRSAVLPCSWGLVVGRGILHMGRSSESTCAGGCAPACALSRALVRPPCAVSVTSGEIKRKRRPTATRGSKCATNSNNNGTYRSLERIRGSRFQERKSEKFGCSCISQTQSRDGGLETTSTGRNAARTDGSARRAQEPVTRNKRIRGDCVTSV